MVWIRRILPVIVLVGGWQAYSLYEDLSREQRAAKDRELALVTAQVWVATAHFRDEPEKYLEYRDSILAAHNLTREEMFSLISRCESDPDGLMPFTQAVNDLVDSLIQRQDSLRVVEMMQDLSVGD
ncbi:MAG: hypothetical protein JSU65_06270 [Candidatus Zixiibacteriota bacterium]|nr:MAG: hypothetical protein JSU65_06270 [candidate division Zixibacteria bacterium]